MFKFSNKNTRKRKLAYFDVLFYVVLVFFIDNFKQVNVLLYNSCTAKSSKNTVKKFSQHEYFCLVFVED